MVFLLLLGAPTAQAEIGTCIVGEWGNSRIVAELIIDSINRYIMILFTILQFGNTDQAEPGLFDYGSTHEQGPAP